MTSACQSPWTALRKRPFRHRIAAWVTSASLLILHSATRYVEQSVEALFHHRRRFSGLACSRILFAERKRAPANDSPPTRCSFLHRPAKSFTSRRGGALPGQFDCVTWKALHGFGTTILRGCDCSDYKLLQVLTLTPVSRVVLPGSHAPWGSEPLSALMIGVNASCSTMHERTVPSSASCSARSITFRMRSE